MLSKVKVKLIYIALTQDDNGSPVSVEKTVEAPANVEGRFSFYYYRDAQRSMRKAMNFSVPKMYVETISDDLTYELRYLICDKAYQVKEILRHKKSSLLALLDCEEVTR